ncbi:hypothetical protein L6164_007499 [Bauhinia variegata]|uniref:Uncharacterized protein n=1 Tax=Bauhinia variegata TaxID=167791 RepID=A0ACB9PCV2_BAUVA|nr:hypothetical protein L6164_007499 [Bauhinia variegata]
MENIASRPRKKDENFELPPGFRFHPTDEELITQYLSHKVLDSHFCARAIGEVDMNKYEPWDLPWRAKMGEKEWYFFSLRDRKYPTGLRTNRATDAGYWKATGKDREIFKAKSLIGMKKTLVFYKGRAPKGQKTNWVMHEYRLEGKLCAYNLPKTARNEWCICRVFQKSSGGQKIHLPGLARLSSFGNESPSSSSFLPPLMDSSPYNSETKTTVGELSHVTCFSDPSPTALASEDQKTQDDVADSLEKETHILASSGAYSNPSDISISPASWSFPKLTPQGSYQCSQMEAQIGNSQFPDCFLVQDPSMMRMLIENGGSNTKQNLKTEFSQDTDLDADISSVIYDDGMNQRSFDNQAYASASAWPVDNGSLWNY